MSPEQARGKPVDKRTDIWAFGCVLSKCSRGITAFPGDTMSDIDRGDPRTRARLGAVAGSNSSENSRSSAPLPAERPPAPPARRRRRATRNRRAVGRSGKYRVGKACNDRRPGRWRHAWFWLTICFFLVTLTAVTSLEAQASVCQRPASRCAFSTANAGWRPARHDFWLWLINSSLAGRLASCLRCRAGRYKTALLRESGARKRRSCQGPKVQGSPSSPPTVNGWRFFADGKLKKVPTNGGPATVLCDANSARGGSWGDGDTIVFSPEARGQRHPSDLRRWWRTEANHDIWTPAKGKRATAHPKSCLAARRSFSPSMVLPTRMYRLWRSP